MKKKTSSIKDVAQQANVSIATVSRFLHGELDRMSAETAQRVKIAINKLNYVPNAAARQLITHKSKIIAIVVVDIADAFSTTLYKGASSVLQQAGYTTVMLDTDSQQSKEEHLINAVGHNTYDGLILQPLSSEVAKIKAEVKRDLPIVILDRQLGHSPWPQIVSDNLQASQHAAKYFFKNGFKHAIVFSSTISIASTRQNRLKGIKSIYPQAKVYELDPKTFQREKIYNNLTATLADQKEKTVLFFLEERWLLLFLPDLITRGLLPSKNIKISGFADSNLISSIWPDAKMIVQDPYQMGKKAGKAMLNLLANKPDIPSLTVVKTTF